MIERHIFWPLVCQVVRSPTTFPEFDEQFTCWQSWFARREPFVVLTVFSDVDALDPVAGGAAYAAQWLQAHRDEFRLWVAGMATVLPPQTLEQRQHAPLEDWFGVPGAWFADAADALKWLDERLRSRSP